ncbi:MAG: ATP phosphoribosyltransferase regulatory subunit [Candidatus Viridilinea halotolerans]|uniref:Histidine--tRNA ligase n=1 Tax=Candidatus Viridilinea halotolerans TaxID=2491704 RepID=A0A426U1Z0_9CHLR|nr:MAG: ATP phosphoribosyltransferase regulatory subunit [Candidatus Viridilinea halotolerans]
MIEAVRGMHDRLPLEQRAAAGVREALEATLVAYGYRAIDLPLLEQRDLYLRKLGEELAGKVYEFSFGGRDLALRPEWTASVLRAYVAHLQDQPLPLRLHYAGPVFRYERPQRHTYRQFTQVGGEIIGGPAPRADAEVLALACAGLDALGLDTYRVHVGHVGLVRQILARLGLSERAQNALVWSLERLRDGGPMAVRARLHEDAGEQPLGLTLPPGLDETQATAWLLRTLEAMQIDLRTGTRSPEAVVERLLRKLRRADEQPAVEHALTILTQLSTISGPPAVSMPAVAAILTAHDLVCPAYDELQAIVQLVAAHGLDPARITIDFGLGRGLHYYTGMIFEIDDAAGLQLCGGGRYDDLVTALGGRTATPAVGFTYGLERVVAAAPPVLSDLPPTALVAPISDEDYAYAQEVARCLREQGLIVTVDLRSRPLARNLSDAARRGIAFVAIVGSEERADRTLVWRDLAHHDERRIALDALASLNLASW